MCSGAQSLIIDIQLNVNSTIINIDQSESITRQSHVHGCVKVLYTDLVAVGEGEWVGHVIRADPVSKLYMDFS